MLEFSIIFFDTNILQLLQTCGEAIFDNYLRPGEEERLRKYHGDKSVREVLALCDIVHVLRRGSLSVAVSVESLREVTGVLNPNKRSKLQGWLLEMIDWSQQRLTQITDFDLRDLDRIKDEIIQSGRLSFLPDANDRNLMAEALALSCHTFLTLDERTILRYRVQLNSLGIDALLPSEFVEKHAREMAGA